MCGRGERWWTGGVLVHARSAWTGFIGRVVAYVQCDMCKKWHTLPPGKKAEVGCARCMWCALANSRAVMSMQELPDAWVGADNNWTVPADRLCSCKMSVPEAHPALVSRKRKKKGMTSEEGSAAAEAPNPHKRQRIAVTGMSSLDEWEAALAPEGSDAPGPPDGDGGGGGGGGGGGSSFGAAGNGGEGEGLVEATDGGDAGPAAGPAADRKPSKAAKKAAQRKTGRLDQKDAPKWEL